MKNFYIKIIAVIFPLFCLLSILKAQTRPDVLWVDIPSGSFEMGSPLTEIGRYENESLHDVVMNGFKMSKYEVTFEQYDAFCDATGRKKSNDEGWGRGKRPVINITWDDAKAFADWMGCRLPTESEWEYACRAGSTTIFNIGDSLPTTDANYDGNFPYYNTPKGTFHSKSMPVGSYPANKWGLHDMHGNVWEWCSDWFGEYPAAELKNPKGPRNGEYRIIRGGSWFYKGNDCRSAMRFSSSPIYSSNYIGIRLVKDN